MLLSTILSLLTPAVSGLVVPRAGGQDVPANQCCFTLHDATSGNIVKQNTRTGYLFLGGNQPDGWYCIDLSDPDKILWDDFNNACFVNPDKSFQCLDPIPSSDEWSLQQSGSDVFIVVNGKSGYEVCPNEENAIYTSDKSDKSQCRNLKLKAQGLKGTCQNFKG